ncbi:MAG: hypothetical protein E7K72_26585 [Roseomonas mucosa]|nr:hypothetical protein [Roseomonas mucosa]
MSEATEARRKSANELLGGEPFTVEIDSRFAWAFAPIILRGQEFGFGDDVACGLQVEPHPQGGALVIAITRHVLAVAWDRSAIATRAVRFRLPADTLTACKPPEPIAFQVEGDALYHPLPAHMRPHRLRLWNLAAWVVGGDGPESEMQKPEEDRLYPLLHSANVAEGNHWRDTDFRVLGTLCPWRDCLRGAGEAPLPAQVHVSAPLVAIVSEVGKRLVKPITEPTTYGAFDFFHDMAAGRRVDEAILSIGQIREGTGQMAVRFPYEPDAQMILMPVALKDTTLPIMQDWLTAERPQEPPATGAAQPEGTPDGQ